MNYINLLIYSTRSWPSLSHSSTSTTVLASVSIHSRQMTSVLLLLSASIKHGTPLPPYYQAPTAVDFSPSWNEELRAQSPPPSAQTRDKEAVQCSWATVQMVTDASNAALARMIRQVRDLVGEVSFDSEGEVKSFLVGTRE